MTVTEGEAERQGAPDDGSDSGGLGRSPGTAASSLPPRAEAVVRRRRVEARQRRVTKWQAASTGLFLVLLVVLVFFGYRAALEIGGGSDTRITDPEAPGYLADPVPTPVDAYVVLGDEGLYASSLLVVPDGSGEGGTVVPIGTILAIGDPQSTEKDPVSFIRDIYDRGGMDAYRTEMGNALGFSIGSVHEVPEAVLEELAAGEPVDVENPDPLITPGTGEGVGEVRYPSGTLTIPPSDIAEFLAFEGADEPAPNQQLRVSQVWEQLIDRAGENPVDDLPENGSTEGADSPGFGEAVEILTAGEVTFDSVPLYRQPLPGNIIVVAWMVDTQYLDDFVARVVPLPVSPTPGRRTATAILNGTNDAEAVSAAVPRVVAGGGEVSLVGNAQSFDVGSTTVEYLYPDVRESAERIAAELGVEPSEGSPPEDPEFQGISVKVVLGSDFES